MNKSDVVEESLYSSTRNRLIRLYDTASRWIRNKQISFTYEAVMRRDIPLYRALALVAHQHNLFPNEITAWARQEVMGYSRDGTIYADPPYYRRNYGVHEEWSDENKAWHAPGPDFFSEKKRIRTFLHDSVAELESRRDASIKVGPYHMIESQQTNKTSVKYVLVPERSMTRSESTTMRNIRLSYDYYGFDAVISQIRQEAAAKIEQFSASIGHDLSNAAFPTLRHRRRDAIIKGLLSIAGTVVKPASKLVLGT